MVPFSPKQLLVILFKMNKIFWRVKIFQLYEGWGSYGMGTK